MSQDLHDAPLAGARPLPHLTRAQAGHSAREPGRRLLHEGNRVASRAVAFDLADVGSDFGSDDDPFRPRAWESFHKALSLLIGFRLPSEVQDILEHSDSLRSGKVRLTVGIAKEIGTNERRVSVTPDSARQIKAAGWDVLLESGAGKGSFFEDRAYEEAGATLVPGTADFWSRSDVVLKIQPPLPNRTLNAHEAELIREGGVLICMLRPLSNLDSVQILARRRVTSFSMDMMPRTTRAQRMDALSSMSTIAGYKAVLLASDTLPKIFPMLVTAAGTIAPSRVLVVGAGVAGLQAIATARRLGAVVEAYDVRPAVKEEVQSLGATFVGHELLDADAVAAGGYAKEMTPEQQARQRQLVADRLKQSDVVISTAMVPGKKAPILIPEATVREMRPGSVIVDLAAEMGGNCELTQA